MAILPKAILGKAKLTKERRDLIRKILTGIALGIVMSGISVLLGMLRLGKEFELYTLDIRYKMRPPVEQLQNLGYVELGDSSLELCGAWPWPRFRHVALIDTLAFYDAKAVAYDVFFIEKEQTTFHPDYIKRLISEDKPISKDKPVMDSAGQGDVNKNDVNKLDANKFDVNKILSESFIDHDGEFASALKKAGNVYLAYFTVNALKTNEGMDVSYTLPTSEVLATTGSIANSLSETRKRSVALAGERFLPIKQNNEASLNTNFNSGLNTALDKGMYKDVDIYPPLPDFIVASKGIGFAQPGLDSDSIVRNYILLRYYNGKIIYPVTLNMLSDLMDFKLNEMDIRPDKEPDKKPGKEIVLKNALDYKTKQRRDVSVPIDEHYQLLLNWAGPFDSTYFHVPFELLSRYYAYIRAKEIARQFRSPEVESFPVIRAKILASLSEEKPVITREAASISDEIAAAAVAESMLARGMNTEVLIKLLSHYVPGDVAAHVVLLVSDAGKMENEIRKLPSFTFSDYLRIYGKPAYARQHAREAFANLSWLAGKNRLEEGRPYYFPPPAKINAYGKETGFSPIDVDGKVLFIGLTGTNTIDLNPTPYEDSSPMVAYHLNFLNSVLTGNFLKKAAYAHKYWVTLFMSTAVGVAGFTLYLPLSILVTLFLGGSYLYTTYALWVQKGIWYEWFVPCTGLALTYMSVLIILFIRAFFEKKKVRNIFARMVSPSVLKVMEENPDSFSLTGQRKGATTFFSMINGMGDIVKSVTPEELTSLLSFYLTPNSEIIMHHGGYIDKYEGHVIMADFGVPLDDELSACNCVFSAINQKIEVEAFRYYVESRFGLKVNMSMGLNYGFISAGNMGSDRKFQYTVMGDPVNVAARFMAANFIYNSSNPITGQDTLPEITDYVYLRHLDKLLLKGKTRPTDLYECLGWKPNAYIALHGERPVPEYLKDIWSNCPPAKVFGYHMLWLRQHAERGHPMAKEISDHFGSSLDLARELALNEWKKEIMGYDNSFRLLKKRLGALFGQPFEYDHEGNKTHYEKHLELWHEDITRIIRLLNDKIVLQKFDNTIVDELLREAEILSNKIELLRHRLERDTAGHDMLKKVIELVKAFITNMASTNVDKLQQNIDSGRKRYVVYTEEFFKKLKPRKEAYHEMMSLAGSPTSGESSMASLYEEGLQRYWQRDWKGSLEKFHGALTHCPEDGPTISMIKRAESYIIAPPGPKWQGEFVQTKK
ncbi:MAG: CHASE2 domain-containing protein [Nitrospirae bacterium]|nr:CHASE2 domain-containing protein [Nitrospirota bacterium]